MNLYLQNLICTLYKMHLKHHVDSVAQHVDSVAQHVDSVAQHVDFVAQHVDSANQTD